LVNDLTKKGRHVIVVGDLNIAHQEIDTHDPDVKIMF